MSLGDKFFMIRTVCLISMALLYAHMHVWSCHVGLLMCIKCIFFSFLNLILCSKTSMRTIPLDSCHNTLFSTCSQCELIAFCSISPQSNIATGNKSKLLKLNKIARGKQLLGYSQTEVRSFAVSYRMKCILSFKFLFVLKVDHKYNSHVRQGNIFSKSISHLTLLSKHTIYSPHSNKTCLSGQHKIHD